MREGFWQWLGAVVNKVLDQASWGLRFLFLALGAGLAVLILGPERFERLLDWASAL